MRSILSLAFLCFLVIYSCAFGAEPIMDPLLTQERQESADSYFKKNLAHYRKLDFSQLEQMQQEMSVKQAIEQKNWYEAKHSLYQILAHNDQEFQAWFLLSYVFNKLLLNNHLDNTQALEHTLTKALQKASSPLDQATIFWLSHSLAPFKHLRQNALTLASEVQIQARIKTLLDQYPQKLAPYLIDVPKKTDIASVCLSWTLPILKNHALENWISLKPQVKDLGISVQSNRLCLEGLTFGENYQLTLKKGFPGQQGKVLAQDQTLHFYIPHRKPTIRFKERGYILPSTGPQIVPLIAVNTAKVKVSLIHIPERNIVSVQSDWFLNQFKRWNMGQLKEENGEVIWEGTYHFPQEMDKTVITGLPIDQIIGKKLSPGVYVLEARLSDKYDEEEFASQALIITDIALSTFKGPDGLHVFARSLQTAQPLENVSITLVSRSNSHLSTLKTNTEGQVVFPHPIINGKKGNQIAFLTASRASELSVLSLTNEPFDFQDRGVAGHSSSSPIEGFITTERGIYRPGETVHLLSLIPNQQGQAITSLPLTLKIFRPDGALAQETLLQDAGTRAYVYDYALNPSAQTGTWLATLFIDPKAEEIGHLTFEVHDFVPPRIEVKSHFIKEGSDSRPTALDIQAEYYFGSPASNLAVQSESTLTLAQNPFPQWSNYHFGLIEEKWIAQKFAHETVNTDEKGHALIQTTIEPYLQTSHLLQLETQATVLDIAGRGRTHQDVSLFWHQPYAIGIAPLFKDNQAPANSIAQFDVIAVDAEGKLQMPGTLHYTLYEEEQDYIWFKAGANWQYEIVSHDTILDKGHLVLTEGQPHRHQAHIKYGNYRLEILDQKTGVASSFRFSAGWAPNQNPNGRPDKVEIEWPEQDLNKDKGSLFIKSPFEGELCLAWANDHLKPIYQGKITKERTKLEIPLILNQATNHNYLIATVYRPANIQNAQMPNRAIGIHWVNNQKGKNKNTIEFNVEAPSTIESLQPFTVKITKTAPHASLRYAVALVDEGTLSLTQFKTPNPYQYFFSQRQLNYEVRDSYGLLINPYGAKPGSFEVGGGDEIAQGKINGLLTHSHKVISLFSGIIDPKGQESITLPFTAPDYTGKLRCMVIAWDASSFGQAEKSILVQNKIDLHLGLPRFLTVDDVATLPLTIKNIKGTEGEYTVHLETEGLNWTKKLTLAPQQEKNLALKLQFANKGIKHIKATLKNDHGFELSQNWQISVRAKKQPITIQKHGQIDVQQTLNLDASLLSTFENNDPHIVFTLGNRPHFNGTQLIKELLAYPYHCLEQTSSRLLAKIFEPIEKNSKEEEIQLIFNQLLSLQKLDGSFGLWSNHGYSEHWLTFYTMDILDLAKSNGFQVPSAINANLKQWLNDYLQSSHHSVNLNAYAHYLLAKENQGSLQALHYFADNFQTDIHNQADLAFIAAAFAHYGNSTQALQWFEKAIYASQTEFSSEDSFGSDLRDHAILVALLGETTQHHPKLFELAHALRQKMLSHSFLSTQEKAWLIRADNALKKNANQKLPLSRTFTASELEQTFSLKNEENQPLYYSLSLTGEPKQTDVLTKAGFEIHREIYQPNGQLYSSDQFNTGELYVVVLQGHRLISEINHILLLDLLPAGFEIENVRLIENDTFPWLNDLTHTHRLEGRDDRFIATFELGNPDHFKVAYLIRAVTKGQFYYPSSYIEAMYQPQYFQYGHAQKIEIH